jgi:hypothetical protein
MAVYNTENEAYDNGEGLTETSLIILKDGSVVTTDNRFPVDVGENYELQVAKGNISGTVGLYKFGVNPDVSGTEEDIWSVGGTYSFATNASTRIVNSSSGSDVNSTGTGAWQVYIEGLDENWELASETVDLNGTNNRTTSNQYRRVFRAYVSTAGTGGTAAGTISIRQTAGGTIMAQIPVGDNQTLMNIYTVPAGKTLYLTNVTLSSGATPGNGEATDHSIFKMKIRPFGGVFRTQLQKHTIETIDDNYNIPLVVTEKSDIVMSAQMVGTTNVQVSGIFQGYLVDNA